MKKEFDLLPSEIKKVNRYATKKNGVPCEITGYLYSGVNPYGVADVRCEVCTLETSDESSRRVADVMIYCIMNDRRRSYCKDAFQ